MTDHFPLEYLISKSREQKSQNDKNHQSVQMKNQRMIDSQQTKHEKIVDMKSAYQRVIDKNHKPTPEEINYRRFTSGSYVDKEPNG